MTTSKKAGTPRKGSNKLNLKKKTLKDLAPRRGKDARGGADCSIPVPPTRVCPVVNTGDCRTVGVCAPLPIPPKIR